MADSRTLVFALAFALASGCSKDPSPPARSVDPVAALTAALTDELAAAERAIAEGAEMDATLKRQEAKLVGARVARRLPVGAIDVAAARGVLTAYSKMHGLGAVELKLGKTPRGPAVPASHLGATPYPYETVQLIATVPIALTVHATDAARLQSFYEAMAKLQLPLMALPTLLVGETTATYSGSIYFRREVTAPVRA
ncbi:MAG: hypothetical protein QF464_19320, partial [Myxococcota bacterium]|nr:hypothetical protein [Myxococcota bacterium]